RSWFMRHLRRFFPTDVAGHSLHAGGATALAACGMTPMFIQTRGHWKSDTW
ncbi:hypothetical protein OBBRIDRAFT_713468, partial [Obba rivulosa]